MAKRAAFGACWVWICGFSVLACSGDASGGPDRHIGSQPLPAMGAGMAAPVAGSSASAGANGFGNSPIGMVRPTQPPPPAMMGLDPGMECSGVEEMAQNRIQPADIIIAIDQSGSMDEETTFVQTQLNAFSQRIVDSGVDAHVILVAIRPGVDGDENGICVPPPLAGDGCADNLPSFKQVDLRVESHDVWDKILLAYDQFAMLLRPEAKKHVLVITDDVPRGVTGAQFGEMLRARDPSFEGFVHHAIYAFTEPNELSCLLDPSADTCCGYAAGAGTPYGELSDTTGGIRANLCEQNFEPVWNALVTKVVEAADLSCDWAIPPPPAGETFDPMKVNVSYAADGIAAEVVGWVENAAACAGVAHGWYYDDNAAPTRVQVCPQTCSAVEALMNPRVAIQFGCQRIVAPPE